MFAVLLLTLAADPAFVVVNKCPPVFTVVNRIAAPEVAAPVRTFQRGPIRHEGHRCPTCNRSQFVIHSGGKGGIHTHRCQYDGTVWQH